MHNELWVHNDLLKCAKIRLLELTKIQVTQKENWINVR